MWKVGGAALANADAVANALGLISRHQGPLVVVVSALSGVTDSLLDGARDAQAGDTTRADRTSADFVRRHREIAHALVPPGPARRKILSTADQLAREYHEITHAVARLGDLSPRASDILVARGERGASVLMAAALTAAGRRAETVDALDIVATNGRYGSAAPDIPTTRRRARTLGCGKWALK